MKKNTIKLITVKQLLTVIGILLLLPCQQLAAQSRKQGGGGKSAGKPAASKPSSANRSSVSKPAAGNNRPDVKKPEANNAVGDRKTNVSNSGNKTNNIGSNNKKVNVDNSKKNVNVNVDNSKNVRMNNSRNTSVRRNSRPYSRPPYVYGGRRYRCYHPYYFHPYRPFVWGPMWHPWGFFVATLATTAIILSVDNNVPGELDMAAVPNINNYNYLGEAQAALSGPAFGFIADNLVEIKDEYYYDAGVYYLKADGGYTVVSAPLGATIKTLPTGYETVSADDNTKNYYYGGTFYEKAASGYTVVAPTAGTVVANVSEGGEEVKMGDVTYVKIGETYYQPIQQDGKDMYEVADVEDDK